MEMNIICLDAEFTESDEMLELSVFNLEGKEIYHRFFRPQHAKEWRTDIHHITPEMVARELTFAERKPEVDELVATADAITGFAVDNDIRILSRHGVKGLDTIGIFDVRDIFWILKGKDEGMSPFAVPSLISCAQMLGLDFTEDEAHSASADTEATLQCFRILTQQYMQEHSLTLRSALNDISRKFESAKADFIKEGASGYVKVLKHKDVYHVKFGHYPENGMPKGSFEVKVEDRYKAEYEVRKMLKKKEVPGKASTYKLTPKLLADLQTYKNEYNAEESAWCKKIVRNLSRLTL